MSARRLPQDESCRTEPSFGDGMDGLWRAFHKVGMKVLDVGARGGSLPWLNFFAPFSTYYGCEPDVSAAAGLSHVLQKKNPWRDCVIMTEAMGSKPGPAKLYLTRHPGFSSVLKPNMAVVRDFGLEEEFTIEDCVETPMIAMQEAAGKYGFEDVGLIKLDTQGSELDILKSGAGLLSGPVQGVYVEVEFRQFYQRQPLFSEVEKFLRGAGFDLVSLAPVTRRRTTTSLQLGYSRRELAWGHALFIKSRPDPDKSDTHTLFERLIRQIAIALATEHFDLAADRIVHPGCAPILKSAGLAVEIDDLETYIAERVSKILYKDFCKSWSGIVKDRPRSYT